MINPTIISEFETSKNPFSFESEYSVIDNFDNESSWCIHEAEDCQINDLVSFDQQLTLLKQLEATETFSNNFCSRDQHLSYESLLNADKDIQEWAHENIQAKNSRMGLSINDSGANTLNLSYIDHDYLKLADIVQEEQLFKNQSDECYQNEKNIVPNLQIQDENEYYFIKSADIDQKGKDWNIRNTANILIL